MSWPAYLKSFPARNEEFVTRGYATGLLPLDVAKELREAVLSSKHTPIDNEVADGAAISRLADETIRLLNEQHLYRELDERTKSALVKAFASMRDEIARLLNSPWRVLNVRSWTTGGKADFGPNAWHRDGDFAEILKVMIYSGWGGIELESGAVGGDWVVFYNSVLLHRGIAPKEGIRAATEVTIAPSVEFDLQPFTLGQAARHALVP